MMSVRVSEKNNNIGAYTFFMNHFFVPTPKNTYMFLMSLASLEFGQFIGSMPDVVKVLFLRKSYHLSSLIGLFHVFPSNLCSSSLCLIIVKGLFSYIFCNCSRSLLFFSDPYLLFKTGVYIFLFAPPRGGER